MTTNHDRLREAGSMLAEGVDTQPAQTPRKHRAFPTDDNHTPDLSTLPPHVRLAHAFQDAFDADTQED